MTKRITRSTVNEQQYSAEAFPKSGFNLTHRRYSSYILGRIQCTGYQDCMPGDKIAGKNDGMFTFNNIVTPMLPNVDVQQYNFYQPFRAIDRTFERAFAPSKDNNMSANWKVPTISTREIVAILIYGYLSTCSERAQGFLNTLTTYATDPRRNSTTLSTIWENYASALYATNRPNAIVSALYLHVENVLIPLAKKLYVDDVFADILANMYVRLGTLQNPISGSTTAKEFFYLLLDCFLTPFVGRYSYFYDFKYNYVRPKDLFSLTDGRATGATFVGLINEFDDTPLSEYPLRINYSIWYEYFRNIDLEPVTNDLPYWRDFGSTSVVLTNICMLVYRPRPWYEDMFISAQIDDLSRHVWAPVYQDGVQVSNHTEDVNNLDTSSTGNPANDGGAKPTSYVLNWQDQITGNHRQITCPVPSNINDVLASVDKTFTEVYGLDLNSLRQAQQMERYLKRNYLFGDEYNDRMLAHYNSRVSDLRINRPELISQSFNSSDNKQEIANMSNGISNAGDRTATATIKANGDNYTTFCEEFGLLVHLITFMPTACYDGVHPQLLLSKVEDFPIPEFATNNEEFGRKIEIAASGLALPDDAKNMFGRYPAYHAWRARVDEVGGMFLDEMQDCTFRRFWGFGDDSIPQLNYQFIHCRPSLQMFRNTNVYDSQIYGDIVHECYVERVLPTPVEKI